LASVIAAIAAGSACAASEAVITGRGWGHGVGMSQWGAYGYARHGWSWQRILAHYYPGTTLGSASNSRVRVLLAAGQPRVSFACPGTIEVSDALGRTRTLAGGDYAVRGTLKLPVGLEHRKIPLPSPIAVTCPSAPILWNGSAYHGTLVIRSDGHRLAVVDAVDLEDYLRGVVGSEMPSHWSLAALEAQAVAARSYALATLRPKAFYDLFADTRSQVYSGLGGESAKTDLAVSKTTGRVLTYRGAIAETFFFSSSGGRTANVRDVWPGNDAIPYLRSVPDPYDASSPNHVWRAKGIAPRLLGEGPVHVVHTPSGRVAAVRIGATELSGAAFERRFHLRSTWFDVGELSLTSSAPDVAWGGKVRLVARANGLGTALLQRLASTGRWVTLASVRDGRTIAVQPRGHTIYRLTALGVRGPEIAVGVTPRLRVLASAGATLRGEIRPKPDGAVTVLRWTHRGWKVVAHPLVDDRGHFHAPVRMQPGAYRISVDGDRRLASLTRAVHVAPRFLASRDR
jgi:stage II sporulation protein D